MISIIGENQRVEECQLTLRLLELMKSTGYELIQENGQRRLTAPEIIRGTKERVKGAEVFLGRLPRDCYEDELMPILSKIGRLMELRVMLDFSGFIRGYAFALYEDSKLAKLACQTLDGYNIRPGHRIGVVRSVDNCRLFFGGVPKNKTKSEFFEELNKLLEGIVDVYLYPSAYDRSLNRGFIFVEFRDHKAAAMARRKLIPGKVTLWNHEVAVDWADPEPGDIIDEEVMEHVTALFVRNLTMDASPQKIRQIFQETTGIKILKLKKINHFAFIHYANRESAQAVMDQMMAINGVAEQEGWEIRWAKPIPSTKSLDKQRCLKEAENLRHSNASPNFEPYQMIQINSNSVPHINALQALVAERFDAICNFQCWRTTDGLARVCVITVDRGEETLIRYYGDPKPSKDKAVSSAALKMYHLISSNLNQLINLTPAPVQKVNGFQPDPVQQYLLNNNTLFPSPPQQLSGL